LTWTLSTPGTENNSPAMLLHAGPFIVQFKLRVDTAEAERKRLGFS
jgi:hypothetical protein